MADSKEQLEACKNAARSFQSQLQTATDKQEALTLAIGAAENLLKALSLATDTAEKQKLRSSVKGIMEVADRIKSSKTWAPPRVPSLPALETKTNELPQSQSHATTNHVTDNPSGSSQTPSALVDLQAGNNAILANVDRQGSSDPPLIDLPDCSCDDPDHSHNRLARNSQPTGKTITRGVGHENASHTTMEAKEATRLSVDAQNQSIISRNPARDTFAEPAKIRKLAEPVSTRKRTKREEVILLKASVVNGFKFPPWDKNPLPSEFTLGDDRKPFVDSRDLELSSYQQQFFEGWVRAVEAVPPPSLLADEGTTAGPLMSTSRPIDLVQDAATDCSVVTSLCAGVARSERGHDQMLSSNVWPYDKNLGRPVLSSNGKYIVRLNFNGCWRKVVIDDRLPVSKTHRLLHVVDRRNPALLWPALIEKAYLKVRGGYDFPGSNSCGDLFALTGWIPEQIYLQETDTVPSQLWKRTYNAFLYGDVLVTVGTGKMSTRQERELGLEGQHSYVVLDMKETDHDKLLLVKNPWVEGKGWRGPPPMGAPVIHTSNNSTSSGRSINRDSVPATEKLHSTTFWIALDQVIQHFESLYLNWNPGLFRYRQDIHFEWTVERQQSTNGCIVKNPQFRLMNKGGEAVWLLLNRHFRDSPIEAKNEFDALKDSLQHIHPSSGESLKGYMSMYVCNGKGERLYIKNTYLESGPYVNTPQSLLRFDNYPGSTYTIVIDQDELPAAAHTFSLSAFSNAALSLEPAIDTYLHQQTIIGQWTKETAGGDTSSLKYFDNPQYTLVVREKTSLALLLTSSKRTLPLHVKLAFGNGKRLYRLQSRDVIADSGGHRGESVFAESKDLEAGFYTIICSLFEAGATGDYTLQVDSTCSIALKAIPREGAGLIPTKLSLGCFAATVNRIAAPLAVYRQTVCTLVARFHRATSPRSLNLGTLARSPLRLSVEKGRGPERRVIISSERGEYSDVPTVRTESFDLEPSLSMEGPGLWLVLDRLSGPGVPVEEWYEVEMFTDVPQPCSVGAWREWDD